MVPKSILLVQYNQSGREALAAILRRYKYHISSATQGMQALALLEENTTNINCLIVVDHFSDMPGQELIAMTRARFPLVKTVMISSQPDDEEEKFVKANGCDVYLPDYSDKNILLSTIERLL
ncbi:MAG: response regulator [Bdellovibrionota bacterium]